MENYDYHDKNSLGHPTEPCTLTIFFHLVILFMIINEFEDYDNDEENESTIYGLFEEKQ